MRSLLNSWTSTLNKLGFKRQKRSVRRLTGYGRRSSLERLEPRQLLANAPWAGNDLVIADFDGDGNSDRLSSQSAASGNEVWYIDTRAASTESVPTTETWRVTRRDGTLVLPEQHAIGDFNGDGRDDMLARESTSPWYVIESRGTTAVGGTQYDGEFIISLWGAVPTTGNWTQPIVGDFNGDGRDDLAAFNAANPNDPKWEVMRSTGSTFEPVEAWAASTILPNTTTVVSGDFNGDGRDERA